MNPDGAVPAELPATSTRTRSATRELLHVLLFAVFFAYLIKTFLVQPFKIPTGSMEDTLLIGDLVLVNKFVYGARTPEVVPFTAIAVPTWQLPAWREPEPGDVIVFKYPPDPTINYVKRCVAVGGQTVEIRDKRLYVDETNLDSTRGFSGLKFEDTETIARNRGYEAVYPEGAGSRDNYGPIVVPEGCVFVLGDNRDRSVDSRHWGFVRTDQIIGRAFAVIWSSRPEDPLEIRWDRVGRGIE